MKILYLDVNSLTGAIPIELGDLQSLQLLYLDVNSLSRTVPSELGNVQSLKYLDCGANNLSGAIPSELGSLQLLKYLDLNSNYLSTTIPASLGSLPSLQYLSLSTNCLTGTIPLDLANLTTMEALWVDSNSLQGELRGVFGEMLGLSALSLSENHLSGSILDELVHLRRLSNLYVDHNHFTGSIPVLHNFTLIQQLDLSTNFFSRELEGLTTLRHFNELFSAQNHFSGWIPEFYSSSLKSIDLSDNLLDGSIGQQLLNCSILVNVAFGGNNLFGGIPSYFGILPALVSLNLSNNELSGDLSEFVLASSLQALDVSSNGFYGILPSQLFELPSLHDVLLYNNCFSGSLPESICSNAALQYLVLNDLTTNCGSGIPESLRSIFQGAVSPRLMSASIPGCVWGMPGLRVLQLSGNGLTGSIGIMVNDSSLRSLLLSGNRLTGTIPEWIQTSSTLQQLDLSQNRLSGTLMTSLVISSASSLFRVSVNRLSGDLPDALFTASSSITLDVLNGNQFSCSSAGGLAGWGSVLNPSVLPPSEVNRGTYVCGSIFFDDYLLFAVVCLLVLGLVVVWVVVFERLAVEAKFENVVALHVCGWRGWSALLLLCVLLLLLYVALHSSPLTQFSTHSEQYLWMTTAAFLRGWAPVLIILLATSAGEVLVVAMFGSGEMKTNVENAPSNSSQSRIHRYRSALVYTALHILCIIAVVATNSAYVYATVNGLPFNQLFAIQLSLGCFKVFWNSAAIPWFLQLSVERDNPTAHRIFMSLFAFIGGPLISTFFTSSDCFLYVVTPQSSLTSTIDVPQYSCTSYCIPICDDDVCKLSCPSSCQFESISVGTTSMPSWIYSFQCSSALLLNYVPVLIAAMAISGFLLPCFVMSQFTCNGGTLISSFTSLAPRSLLIGNSFDVMKLNRFLHVKSLVNIAIMLTFGFASPLLGVLIVLDALIFSWMKHMLICRQIRYLQSNEVSTTASMRKSSIDQNSVNILLDSAPKEPIPFNSSDMLIVISFVGMFWSLFVFDMIGDVYGNLSGGLSTLVPPLLSGVIWLIARQRGMNEQKCVVMRSVTSPGIELCNDPFAENPIQRSEQAEFES